MVIQTGRSQVMPVEIPPTAPDLLIHQSVNVVEMNRLHCSLEIERPHGRSAPYHRPKANRRSPTHSPNPSDLGILRKGLGNIAQSSCGGILRRQLGHAGIAITCTARYQSDATTPNEVRNHLRSRINGFPIIGQAMTISFRLQRHFANRSEKLETKLRTDPDPFHVSAFYRARGGT